MWDFVKIKPIIDVNHNFLEKRGDYNPILTQFIISHLIYFVKKRGDYNLILNLSLAINHTLTR
jgi:hypothetical protein